MPQERHNPFPYPTRRDVEEAPGSREIKAARNIMVRNIPGVPRRDYLLGHNDRAPILRGVADLTAAAYAVLDAIDSGDTAALHATANTLDAILKDHGCPDYFEVPENELPKQPD